MYRSCIATIAFSTHEQKRLLRSVGILLRRLEEHFIALRFFAFYGVGMLHASSLCLCLAMRCTRVCMGGWML